MLSKFIKLVTLISFISYMLPAQAINSEYRNQLERSGCTQLTDGNGCDINKTKEQNGLSSVNGEMKEIKEFIKYSVINQKTDAAYEALEGYGWNNPEPATWVKGKYTMILSIQDDTVINAIVK